MSEYESILEPKLIADFIHLEVNLDQHCDHLINVICIDFEFALEMDF